MMTKNKNRILKVLSIVLAGISLFMDLAWAGPGEMLSPKLQIGAALFQADLARISSRKFIAPDSSLPEKILLARQIFSQDRSNFDGLSLWPRFFLKQVLDPGTNNLRSAMQELIQWLESPGFESLDNLERLGYIETLAKKLSPFEKILFYEGVYFVEPNGAELGFGINRKPYWGTLYLYGKTQFAHGAVHEGKTLVELTFGDDLKWQKLADIKYVHFYAYMKRLADVYVDYPGKAMMITHDQLLALATEVQPRFLPQALNFYLVKVGGFMPEYEAPEGAFRELQQEYLSQLRNGLHISFKDAEKIINAFGLNRDISAEEKEFLAVARAQDDPERLISKKNIRSRDILPLPEDDLRAIDDEKYPVEVKDRIITDNLGYCSGAVFSSQGRMWFRRYGENPDIMEALEKDLKKDKSKAIFNDQSKVVLMSTSYGSWRWNLEEVRSRLVDAGVSAENIVILESETDPGLDGISVYLFPDKTAVIHQKNHGLGVFATREFSGGLQVLHAPKVLSRFDVEDMALDLKAGTAGKIFLEKSVMCVEQAI